MYAVVGNSQPWNRGEPNLNDRSQPVILCQPKANLPLLRSKDTLCNIEHVINDPCVPEQGKNLPFLESTTK